MFIFVAIKWYRSDNESCEGNDTEDPDVNFEQPVNQAENDEEEDWGLPLKLKRMVEQEERLYIYIFVVAKDKPKQGESPKAKA